MKKQKIKIRRDWGNMNPVTKIKDSKKKYSRKHQERDERDYDDYFEFHYD